jgi:hypothetical protein
VIRLWLISLWWNSKELPVEFIEQFRALGDRPGDAAVGQANQLDLATNFTMGDITALKSRRSVRAEAKFLGVAHKSLADHFL